LAGGAVKESSDGKIHGAQVVFTGAVTAAELPEALLGTGNEAKVLNCGREDEELLEKLFGVGKTGSSWSPALEADTLEVDALAEDAFADDTLIEELVADRLAFTGNDAERKLGLAGELLDGLRWLVDDSTEAVELGDNELSAEEGMMVVEELKVAEELKIVEELKLAEVFVAVKIGEVVRESLFDGVTASAPPSTTKPRNGYLQSMAVT
jgi:hypothetical protein